MYIHVYSEAHEVQRRVVQTANSKWPICPACWADRVYEVGQRLLCGPARLRTQAYAFIGEMMKNGRVSCG